MDYLLQTCYRQGDRGLNRMAICLRPRSHQARKPAGDTCPYPGLSPLLLPVTVLRGLLSSVVSPSNLFLSLSFLKSLVSAANSWVSGGSDGGQVHHQMRSTRNFPCLPQPRFLPNVIRTLPPMHPTFTKNQLNLVRNKQVSKINAYFREQTKAPGHVICQLIKKLFTLFCNLKNLHHFLFLERYWESASLLQLSWLWDG